MHRIKHCGSAAVDLSLLDGSAWRGRREMRVLEAVKKVGRTTARLHSRLGKFFCNKDLFPSRQRQRVVFRASPRACIWRGRCSYSQDDSQKCGTAGVDWDGTADDCDGGRIYCELGRFSARGGSCDIARHLTHSCICQPESGGLLLGISKEAELTMLTLVADNTRQGVCQVMVSTI